MITKLLPMAALGALVLVGAGCAKDAVPEAEQPEAAIVPSAFDEAPAAQEQEQAQEAQAPSDSPTNAAEEEASDVPALEQRDEAERSEPSSSAGTDAEEGVLSGEVAVAIRNSSFQPASLTVRKGTTVVWTNMDLTGHSVTSDAAGQFDSKLLSQGKSFSKSFDTAGTFSYHCTPHPFMQATVTVVE